MNAPFYVTLLPLVAVFVAALFVLSAALLWLWNTTIPTIFGLRNITYWEAFRLLLIASILFGRGCYSSSTVPLPPPGNALQQAENHPGQ